MESRELDDERKDGRRDDLLVDYESAFLNPHTMPGRLTHEQLEGLRVLAHRAVEVSRGVNVHLGACFVSYDPFTRLSWACLPIADSFSPSATFSWKYISFCSGDSGLGSAMILANTARRAYPSALSAGHLDKSTRLGIALLLSCQFRLGSLHGLLVLFP